MEIALAQVINGLMLGFIYAIVATGYNLLALVTGVLHWAHSHLLVLGMYIAWAVLELTQGNLALSIVAGILGATLISALVGPLFQPFIKTHATLEGFVTSLGISIIIMEIMSHWLNAGDTIVFPPTFGGQQVVLSFGMVVITSGQLLTLFGSIILAFAFFHFLNQTKQGRMLRAVAQDTTAARILGISVPKMSLLSFAIAGFMGGVTAIFLALTVHSASPNTGNTLAMKALAVLLMGSSGNLKGGVICALVLGITESLVTGYIAGQWADAISMSLVVLILIVRPQGMFGPQY